VSATVVAAAPRSERRTPGMRFGAWIARAYRRLGWRQAALAALIFVLAATFGPNGGAWLFPGTPTIDPIAHFLAGRWVWQMMPLVFAAMVADEAHADGVRPVVAYGLAMLIGGFAAAVIDMVGWNLFGWGRSWSIGPYRTKQIFLQGSVCMAVYAYWRTTQHALGRVRASEADRVRDRQQLLAARLLALQARVEPQFLFDALSRIGELHAHDPEVADALLADLIALLRAMLPVGTAAMSTVEREFALARAWSRVQQRLGSPFDIEIDASPLAAQSSLGPMLVVPLLQEILAVPHARAFGWRLAAEPFASDDAASRTPRLRVRLAPAGGTGAEPPGDAAAPTPSIKRLRERLDELYGGAATFEVTTLRGGVPVFTLDLPLAQETADDDRADR